MTSNMFLTLSVVYISLYTSLIILFQYYSHGFLFRKTKNQPNKKKKLVTK